jgi:hypothetical protein
MTIVKKYGIKLIVVDLEKVVMAQVVGEKAVIIEDVTDKPLVEALIAGGIPREKIVLAYQGEKLSDEGKG